MSFVIKHIDCDLSPGSLDRAIAQITTIQTLLYPAMMNYIEKLAAKGVEIARAELIFFPDPAYYTGTLSESIRYEMNEHGATISAGEGAESGYSGTSYAIMVEYGTGIFGPDIHGHGAFGWFYRNPNDGKIHHTLGMEGRPFMGNTYLDLQEEVRVAGGRIIAEYLAENS